MDYVDLITSTLNRFPGFAADGIGSPTDTAHIPPGVVTKIDSIQTRKSSAAQTQAQLSSTGPPRRMMCKNCNKKCNCVCKKCSFETVRPYARRENIALGFDEKTRLQNEILQLSGTTIAIKEQMCFTEERLITMRIALENAKLRIGAKQKEISVLDGKKPTVASQFSTVFGSHQKHHIRSAEISKELKNKLNAIENSVAQTRYQYCITSCRMFPVRILDVDVVSVPQQTKSSRKWAVVNDSELQQGRRITIRSSYINEKLHAKLGNHLSNGTISLPLELHPSFAAFTNTLQLVHLLNVIFNFIPPEPLSHHDLCIRDRWTKESWERDWMSLCKNVVYLCAFIGMKPSELKFLDPHHNLIALSTYVFANPDKIQRIGSRPMCDLAEVEALIESQRPEDSMKKDDVDESWIFVD